MGYLQSLIVNGFPMFHIGTFDESSFAVPYPFIEKSRGYARANLVDRSHGSVHMSAGICKLDAGGSTELCLHAYKKASTCSQVACSCGEPRRYSISVRTTTP